MLLTGFEKVRELKVLNILMRTTIKILLKLSKNVLTCSIRWHSLFDHYHPRLDTRPSAQHREIALIRYQGDYVALCYSGNTCGTGGGSSAPFYRWWTRTTEVLETAAGVQVHLSALPAVVRTSRGAMHKCYAQATSCRVDRPSSETTAYVIQCEFRTHDITYI